MQVVLQSLWVISYVKRDILIQQHSLQIFSKIPTWSIPFEVSSNSKSKSVKRVIDKALFLRMLYMFSKLNMRSLSPNPMQSPPEK